MKITQLLATLVLTFTTAAMAAMPMVDGEVRKVDMGSKKITLKHGEIKNLNMPPMTMVFQVKDPLTVLTIEPAKM